VERQDICLDLTSIGNHLSDSTVIDDAQVRHGYYVESNMTTTIIRSSIIRSSNVIMLSVAWGMAASLKVDSDPLYNGTVYVG
jgi:7-cyano-7-deazaguanine synthase in queuosine biosynthesis